MAYDIFLCYRYKSAWIANLFDQYVKDRKDEDEQKLKVFYSDAKASGNYLRKDELEPIINSSKYFLICLYSGFTEWFFTSDGQINKECATALEFILAERARQKHGLELITININGETFSQNDIDNLKKLFEMEGILREDTINAFTKININDINVRQSIFDLFFDRLYMGLLEGMTVEEEDKYDFVMNDGGVILTRYKGNSANIVVPKKVYGKKVVKLEEVFNQSGIKSVVIPDSVTSIDSWAFLNCKDLESITVDENNSEYSSLDGILYNKAKTEFVHIPGEIKGAVILPDTIIGIDSYVFRYNNKLQFNEYDNALYLGSYNNPYFALIKAKDFSIDSCKVHPNTRIIASYAFEHCCNLSSITLSDNITNIGCAFNDCRALVNINYLGTIESWCKTNQRDLMGCVASNKKLVIDSKEITGKLVIPPTVTAIAPYAFAGTGITEIVISNTVTRIGAFAFYCCRSITNVIMPDNVTCIDDSAFWGCKSLTNIAISNGILSVGSGVFYECDNLQYNEYDNAIYVGNKSNPYLILLEAKDTCILSCEVHENTQVIADCAFYDCESLKNIFIPSSVKGMGISVFENCSSLTIYCEMATMPSNWDYDWNIFGSDIDEDGEYVCGSGICRVVWGYKKA